MPRKRLYWVLFIAVYLASAIWSVPAFLAFNFGEVSFDQVLFFLTTEDGTMGTDRLVLLSALDVLVLRPLAVTLVMTLAVTLIAWCVVWLRRKLAKPSSEFNVWHRPRLVPIAGGLFLWALLALPLVSAYNTLEDIGGIAFFVEHEGPDRFAQLYVEPPARLDVSVAAQPAGSVNAERKPRNLILLYVESLETTFSDADYFAVDLNAPLAGVFDRKPLGIHEMAGTNWTTAGMIASQCAVPLATFIWNKAEFKPGAMLGKAKCLGDYLSELGYKQYFLVGPELKFSGMDKFYRHHGYGYTFGKQELLEAGMPEDKLTGWGGGVNDDTLLDLAFEQIVALYTQSQRGGSPFNVTVITTDNHAPDGYLSPRCPPSDLTPSFARVIDCSNRFVAAFYDKLKQAGVLQDTVLVVMGDHLFMNNPEQKHLFPKRDERRVYFNYLSPGGEVCEFGSGDMTHFDVAPTLLALLVDSQTQQMGVGDNLCQPVDVAAKQARNAVLRDDIASHSQVYRSLW